MFLALESVNFIMSKSFHDFVIDPDVGVMTILKKDHPVIEMGKSLLEAMKIMRENNTGCLPVCKDGKPVGIFTEHDILHHVINEKISTDCIIDDHMVPIKGMVTTNETIGTLIHKMAHMHYRHYCVVNPETGMLEGVVSVRGILRFLAEHFPEEILNQPPNKTRYSDTVEGG